MRLSISGPATSHTWPPPVSDRFPKLGKSGPSRQPEGYSDLTFSHPGACHRAAGRTLTHRSEGPLSMSLLSSRAPRRATAVAAAATLVVGASLAVSAQSASAVTNYGVTITTVSPVKVGASLGNRVVVINGTNFDEDQITGITLGADADCANLQSYVVTSSTQISVKTPNTVGNTPSGTAVAGCIPSPGGAAEDVTIIQTGSGTATKTAALTFVPPPSIDEFDATSGSEKFPVYTDNSSSLAVADRVRELSAAGAQVIRVKAGTDFAFDGRATSGLSGTLGGKPLTTVGFVAADGSAQAATAAPVANANFWLATTGTALTASTTPVLSITQGTVARNFASTATGLTIVTTPTVVSLDKTSGKTGAATTVKITGTNFSTVASELAVTICGKSAPLASTPVPTATSITVITPNAAATPATTLADLKTAIGGTAGVCPVVVTRTVNSVSASSAITPTSFFAFVDR
ncbi:IPT/TIG domain-containing protein [Actinoplanes sp. NPDC051494]|uniref:IPT/TIG domain-containing protein n=1 Tax=Actinoplanes sp. NPDC051494 TaxID=3363907 RepID=UPI00378C4655